MTLPRVTRGYKGQGAGVFLDGLGCNADLEETWCLRAYAPAPTIAPRRCRPGVVTECQSVALVGLACDAHALLITKCAPLIKVMSSSY